MKASHAERPANGSPLPLHLRRLMNLAKKRGHGLWGRQQAKSGQDFCSPGEHGYVSGDASRHLPAGLLSIGPGEAGIPAAAAAWPGDGQPERTERAATGGAIVRRPPVVRLQHERPVGGPGGRVGVESPCRRNSGEVGCIILCRCGSPRASRYVIVKVIMGNITIEGFR